MLRYLFCVLLAPVAIAAAPARAADTTPAENVAVTVRTADLDDPARAREVYARLDVAAHRACDASPAYDVAVRAANEACRDDALDEAVRHLNRPALTAAREADLQARADAVKARPRR